MKIVKSSCSSKRKVRTCTFSPQVNIKNKRTAVQTEQDVNAAHSEAKLQDLINDIKSNIYTKVKAVATSPDFGFDENEVDDYFFVEASATEIGEDHHEAIRVEVRGEVSYEGLEDLMEALNPIIESYDSYAYFEPVEPGIIEAYVSVNQIDMSIYGATAFPDHMFYDYHGKRFSVHDNSSELRDDVIEDVYYLWKASISQQAGAYNDADEDYVYAFIRGRGVVEYYKKGKYVATSNYNLRDEDDFEQAWEYMEIIVQDVCDRLIAYNKDVPDRMVYNSTSIQAADDEFHGYADVASDSGRSVEAVDDLSSYPEEFRNAYQKAKTEFINRYPNLGVSIIRDDPYAEDGEVAVLVKDYDTGDHAKCYLVYSVDEMISSDYEWMLQAFEETAEAIGLLEDNTVYSSVESSDYESDSGIFIEDIIDSLEDNGYDLSRIRSIRQGLLKLFGYKGKDADIIIHDLVAGGFIDPNDWVDKDYTPGIYSATNDGEGYWFFTTHGVQPGSVPRDVDILDIIDTPNGSFVKFNRFLSTKELNEYDMVEKSPKSVMSAEADELRSVEATTEYLDIGGILGEPNVRYSSEDLRSIYEEGKHHDPLTYIYEKGKHHDPLISQYDSYESWFKDIEQYLYEIYSDTEDITSSTDEVYYPNGQVVPDDSVDMDKFLDYNFGTDRDPDNSHYTTEEKQRAVDYYFKKEQKYAKASSNTDDKVFIEDIIDGLEDNGYDLTRISSIKRGIWELFGYKEKDADIIIHDLIAGGFIDPNNWVDKDYIPSIYSSTEEDSSSRTNSYDYRLGDTVSYNGDVYIIIDDEDDLLTLRPQSRFSDDDFDDPELGDSSEDVFLAPWQLRQYGKVIPYGKVINASEAGEDLPMVDQEYDSAATSINSNKLPAIYKMVSFNEGDVVVDFGGGKFDNAVEYIKDKGATLCVYDPYNRSAEHNKEVLRILRENGGADAAVNSNVLNVIKEPEARKNVLENIARITKPGAPIYITVYEGKGNGQEGPTKSGYQLNRKTADYLEEIQEVFPDATRRGKLITAHNSGSVSSSINIQAANNPSYEKYLLNQVRSLLISKLESEYDIEFFITDMYIDGDDMHIQVYGDDALHGDIDIPVDYSGDAYDFADDAFNKLKDIFQNNSSNIVEGSQDISRYDKEVVSYREIISKSVKDNDDFLTDYTMYEVVTEDGSVEYECYFGDNDLYGPWNGEGLDFEADNYDEAVEWYNSYSSDEIQSSTVLDSNTEFRENFEEAVDIFYEEYPATVELTDEQDEEYDTLYKAYVRETGVLYSVKPGVVYIDIDWDSSDILQALEETAEAIGIEHYPDPLDVDASESIQGDAFSELEDAYLSPPEYDDPIEHEDSQELIEVELDQVITVDVDGDYEWDDDTYVWASPDGSNEEWRSEDGVYIDDKVGVVEHIDDLIIPNVPTRPGKYRVTGLAQLIYDVSGIQEYRTNYGPDDYESDLDTDHAVVAFNFSQSTVENLKITPVRR